MTHASVPVEVRQQLGIADTLIRLSVGIEALPDLIHDLAGALQVSGTHRAGGGEVHGAGMAVVLGDCCGSGLDVGFGVRARLLREGRD